MTKLQQAASIRLMNKLFAGAAFSCILACNSESATAQPAAVIDAKIAAYATYEQYCMGCHGRAMEGGSGGSLIDAEWKHGSTREAIYTSISKGIPDLGMPAYGETLTQAQMNQLVDLIESKTIPENPASAREGFQGDKVQTLDYEIGVERWIKGVDSPWGLAFMDANTAIVTEKTGGVRVISNILNKPTLSPKLKNIPDSNSAGQGGMLAVAVHPNYADNGWIYLAYSHNLPQDPSLAMTRVVRGKLAQGEWTNQETIWQADASAYTSARHHYGVRLVFGPDGMLYFPIGDRGSQNRAQKLNDPAGKIHRITPEGAIPEDNPFVAVPGAVKSVWSFGQRNPQGLAFHPVTGDLWESEHGPRGGDELNLIQPSLNYGWPEITYGINYNGRVITKERVRPGIEQPIWYWRPSIAVCGIDFYEGNQFPFWQNHLLVSSLANQTLRLVQIQNERVIHEEVIIRDRGRIRDVVTGPDGSIYLLINGPDEILRLSVIKENMI
ncbi:MAG: PQQ-dependent sugar dehydrogenase [Sumerlaeia bacterium]